MPHTSAPTADLDGNFRAGRDKRWQQGEAVPDRKPPTGHNRKREASREYAWSAQVDSGIITQSRNSNLIGK